MDALSFDSKETHETIDLGERLGRNLRRGDIVCLFGDLGGGKTTFVKGLAKGLKVKLNSVNSPTFVLMNIYEGKIPLYHFDLYRLRNTEELQHIGYEEFLYGEGIAAIEWAERLEDLLPKEHLAVRFEHKDEGRRINFSAKGKRYQEMISRFT